MAATVVATNDSTLNKLQIQAWRRSVSLLDSLGRSFIDTLLHASADQRVELQRRFLFLQDSLCRSTGLELGYKEYLSIQQKIRYPKNKSVAASVGILIQ